MRLFRRRGLTPESWYAPRRHALTTGFAIVAGVVGAFYAGATQWVLLSDPEYSLALNGVLRQHFPEGRTAHHRLRRHAGPEESTQIVFIFARP